MFPDFKPSHSPAMPKAKKESIRSILVDFLERMKLTFSPRALDSDAFTKAASEWGFTIGFEKENVDTPEFQPALSAAVAITVTAYRHLEDIHTQYWIALYTACLIYFDDLSATEPDVVREFHTRFITAQPQKHPLLDNCAHLLRIARSRFNACATSLIISSTLDFMTGLVLDFDHKEMKVEASASSYPRYFRTMMGVATPYAVFMFPPRISMKVYIQVLPDIIDWTNNVNDIFSFYKEELANEDTNHISLIAKVNGWSKLGALQYLVDCSVEASRRTKAVLASHVEAYKIYANSYVPGYVAFHAAATKRYKLEDLEVEVR